MNKETISPPPWIFKCFFRGSNGATGTDVINEWYDQLDEEAQGEIDATFEILTHLPNHEWKRPRFDKLEGKICCGLHEIRIKAASGQYRILGGFGKERNEFTLYVAYRKQRDSDTNTACKVAQARKKEASIDGAKSKKCQFL